MNNSKLICCFALSYGCSAWAMLTQIARQSVPMQKFGQAVTNPKQDVFYKHLAPSSLQNHISIQRRLNDSRIMAKHVEDLNRQIEDTECVFHATGALTALGVSATAIGLVANFALGPIGTCVQEGGLLTLPCLPLGFCCSLVTFTGLCFGPLAVVGGVCAFVPSSLYLAILNAQFHKEQKKYAKAGVEQTKLYDQSAQEQNESGKSTRIVEQ